MFTFYFATKKRKSSAGEKQAGLNQMVNWTDSKSSSDDHYQMVNWMDSKSLEKMRRCLLVIGKLSTELQKPSVFPNLNPYVKVNGHIFLKIVE